MNAGDEVAAGWLQGPWRIGLALFGAFLLGVALTKAASFALVWIHQRRRGLPVSVGRLLLTMVREIVCVWAVLLLHLPGELGFPAAVLPPPGQRSRRRPVVLVHGYTQNRSNFLVILRRLAHAGWDALFPVSIRPKFARIEAQAQSLARHLERAVERSGHPVVDLVCHSQGGILVRHLLRQPEHARLIGTVITIGTPHRGTLAAAIGPGRNARQLQYRSPWLRDLNREEERRVTETGEPGAAQGGSFVSIYAEYDNLVVPPESADLRVGWTTRRVQGWGHMGMLYSSEVFEQIVTVLNSSQQAALERPA